MNFITIDFETASSDRSTPCEIGLTFVENNVIVETKSWLIKPHCYPYFDEFNVFVHGIRPEDVAHAPTFIDLWEVILPLVEGKFLIAHNAGFDMSVLRNTLDVYDIAFPSIQYACSYIFSKNTWQSLPSYALQSLCYELSIDLDHHRAGPDSKATAELALRAFEHARVESIEDIPENMKCSLGSIFPGGYNACRTKRIRDTSLAKFCGDPNKHKPDSPFYGKTLVFTGTLSSMLRAEAHQIVVDIGGSIANGVTKGTHFLVVGQQDFRYVGEDGLSGKQEKAIKMVEKGIPIEIISEDEFLKNL